MIIKLSYYCDIICPHSWVGYQILQRKLLQWSQKANVTVDYFPVLSSQIQTSAGIPWNGESTAKENYRQKELMYLCKMYGFPHGNFSSQTTSHRERCYLQTRFFLTQIKRLHPELHQLFMEKFWTEYWQNNQDLNKAVHLLKAGREIGIPFKLMDHLVAHVENEQNILDLKQNTYEAIVDGAFETPWIKITQEGSNFGFNEITRLEMLDHFIENPDLLQKILALFPDSSKERIERIEKLKKRLKRVYLFNECKEVKDLTVMELLSENYNCTDEGTTKNII